MPTTLIIEIRGWISQWRCWTHKNINIKRFWAKKQFSKFAYIRPGSFKSPEGPWIYQ